MKVEIYIQYTNTGNYSQIIRHDYMIVNDSYKFIYTLFKLRYGETYSRTPQFSYLPVNGLYSAKMSIG